MIVADPCPRFIEVDAPINADNISSCLNHRFQQRCRAGPEVDRGRAGLFHRVEDALSIGQHETAIDARAERANPAIKELDYIRSCLDLSHQIIRDHWYELV